MLKRVLIAGASFAMLSATAAYATDSGFGPCAIDPGVVKSVQEQLFKVVQDGNGGLFKPNLMWSAVVDRRGVVCSVITNSENNAWPGSRAIALAKAFTANGFSNSQLAISTANLYAPTQPGGSLYGLNNSNPFNPAFDPQHTGLNQVAGGIITFGGGVALYKDGQVIGGLGVSGDTSCADHAIAWRMRQNAGLQPSFCSPLSSVSSASRGSQCVKGPNSSGNDNIEYAPAGKAPTGFQQPHCLPTDVTPTAITPRA